MFINLAAACLATMRHCPYHYPTYTPRAYPLSLDVVLRLVTGLLRLEHFITLLWLVHIPSTLLLACISPMQ